MSCCGTARVRRCRWCVQGTVQFHRRSERQCARSAKLPRSCVSPKRGATSEVRFGVVRSIRSVGIRRRHSDVSTGFVLETRRVLLGVRDSIEIAPLELIDAACRKAGDRAKAWPAKNVAVGPCGTERSRCRLEQLRHSRLESHSSNGSWTRFD